MKDWFPLTDYDFYACLTAGIIIVAGCNIAFYNSSLVNQADWTVAQGLGWVGISYIVGQISAAPSSALLEHVLARRVLREPVAIALGLVQPRRRERVLSALFAQFEYVPLPSAIQENVKKKAEAILGVSSALLTSQSVFQVAFPYARGNSDSAARLDRFISLYGFARNVSFASLVSSVVLVAQMIYSRCWNHWGIVSILLFISFGMFGRFLKFYAAYSAEVIRAFFKQEGPKVVV